MRPTFPWVAAAAFVLVWSSGYISGPAGVEAVEPFSLLALRFALAAAVLVPLARWRRGPLRMDRTTLTRVALVGVTMNAVQFGLMYLAFDAGLGATLGALLHSISPVLTVVLAGLVLAERVRPVQVLGLVIGLVGVVIVLGPDLDEAGGAVGVSLGLLSMLALSLGTMGQRWIPAGTDPWWSASVQFVVSVPPLAALALVVEGTDPVSDPGQGLAALLYLAVVNSVLGLLLLGSLVRRGGAGASSSVFFLMPPVTAVLAYLVLGETLGPVELVGLVVAVVGVAVATRRRSAPAGDPAEQAADAAPDGRVLGGGAAGGGGAADGTGGASATSGGALDETADETHG
jgi:drug/metabolite transporter (DMT)-like permease